MYTEINTIHTQEQKSLKSLDINRLNKTHAVCFSALPNSLSSIDFTKYDIFTCISNPL